MKLMLDYYEGMFNAEELNTQQKMLNDNGIELVMFNKNGQSFNAFPNLEALILHIDVNFITNAMVGGAIYDVFIRTVRWIWSYAKEKINYYTSNYVEEREVGFNLHINIAEKRTIYFEMPIDLDKEKQNECVDSILTFIAETAKQTKIEHIETARYDKIKQKWSIIKLEQLIKERRSKVNE